MKKKYLITGLTCLLILVSGIFYSCAYHKDSAVLVTDQNVTNKDLINQNVASQNSEGIISQGQDIQVGSTGSTAAQIQTQPEQEAYIYVHICGAVKKPGVYQIKAGARLVDLIALSGGLNPEAAGDYINQAVQVIDGQRIYIPTEKEVKDLSAVEYMQGDISASEDTKSSVVNVNTADAEELMNLPGIGQVKADSIINFRDKNGKFKTIEDLMNIPGIKEGLFNQISSLIVAK